MQARIVIALCALIASSVLEAQESLPLVQDELMHRARVWEARDRGDLARRELEKLAAAQPGSADALLELGELNLRLADMRAAEQVLSLLNKRFPGSPEARTFAIEYRFASRDRLQLASVRRLIQMGQEAQARQELDRLFPEGAPGGMLGIEYYRFLASTPSGWEPAYQGLKKLAAEHPDNPRYAIALAKHLLDKETTVVEGAVALSELARRDDVRVVEIDDTLSRVLIDAQADLPLTIFEEYLKRNPNNVKVRSVLRVKERALEEKELLVSGVLARINADLQERNLRALSGALAAHSSSDALAAEGSVLCGLLAGELPESASLADGTALAASLVIRSQQSRQVNHLELAAALLHAATALRTGAYESVIPVSRRLESLGESALSGEVLAMASKLDADSGWLFSTYVTWLINNGKVEEALSRLEAHPINERWTAQSRDALRARALEQRSRSHEAAERVEEAIADLEAAVALAPEDPWSRYRLAGLLAQQGDPERGRTVLAEGVRRAGDDAEMRYAQSLYLAGLDDHKNALAAIERVPPEEQTEGMVQLQARMRIEVAGTEAQRLKASDDLEASRAELLNVEPLAQLGADRLRQIAFAWINLGDSQHAVQLTESVSRDATNDPALLLTFAEVLDRAGDTERLASVLDQLRALPLNSEQQPTVEGLQKSLELQRVRMLQHEGDIRLAERRLEAMLRSASPDDRELRILRAELDLAAGNPRTARDRLVALMREQPEDLETRLIYVRALTESGEIATARAQLRAIQEEARADDISIQIGIARRQLAMGDAAGADQTVQAVLPIAPRHADALLLAGQAAQERRNYAAARDYFDQAQRAGDESAAERARLAHDEIDARLQSWAEGALELREKPGESGISEFSSITVPTAWVYTRSDGQRFTLRSDMVRIDPGRLSDSFDSAALLGTIQVAGAQAQRLYENDAQSGISLGIEYATDTLHADLGTTPRDFLLPQIVGGIEWTPGWGPFDLALALSRRPVTGSVLSYGGLRDPISGEKWGGVVATGPSARIALYRERYGISASVTATQLTGTRVPDNQFFGTRAAAEWKFLARENARAYLGLTVNYWNYDKNLQNYTFGSGGYYSPQSYLSITVPIELQGLVRGWNFRLRGSLTHASSKVDRAPFYPADPDLQSQAAASPLPAGFDEPFFEADRSSGLSMSAYAAVERRISRAFVVGAKVDIDRADYYEPTTYMLYLRHVFGSSAARLEAPPHPVRPYGDY